MKFRVGACALLVCLAGCSGKGPNTDFAELRGAAATKSATQLPKLQLGRAAAESIANAPDRGALVSYRNKGAPSKREGAFTFYPVAISEDHALKALVTGEMSMPMPDGSQVKLKYERHNESPDGNWTWIGRVVGGDPQQEAIVTFGEKAVFASIPQANGAPPLSIQTRNGALFAVQTDASKVKSPNKGHNDMVVPSALALREAAAAQAQTNAQVFQNAIAQNAPLSAANTIDVAIGYTAGYRATYGSQSAATTRLAFLVQVGNQAYSNSSITGSLRLVSATEVAYTDGNSNQTALHELTGSTGTAAPSDAAVPASLMPLRTARNQSGADIAILVRDFQQPEHQGCGIAWLIGADQREIVPSDAQWAYAVVSDGDDAGTDNQVYYCAPETLIHEASHLMGSAHDVANAANASGRYPYSYGYKTANGNFYTIMAYGDEGQTPYRVFSNPNIATCGGNACGVANQADNARSLNQTIPVVAQFRAMVVPLPPGSYPGQIQGANGRCMDVAGGGTANGSTIQMWACNGFRQQEWSFTNSTGSFVGNGTSRVMDVVGNGTTSGTRVQLWDSLGGLNQAWRFTNAAIVSSGGRVLDAVGVSSANGTRIQLYDSLKGVNQTWNFDPRTGAIIGIGGKCLDVVGLSTANGAEVQLWECTGGQNQKWSIGPEGRLIGLAGKCLDAVGGGTANGTRLQMWDCNGNAQQSWAIRGEIRSVLSDRCLDDAGGGTGNGSTVMIFDCHGRINQQWTYWSK